jgi:hypothetical protein
MDDRTLAICAATLCLLGVSLTQTLGSGAGERTGYTTTTAFAPANVSPTVAALETRSAIRESRTFAPAK